MTIYVAMRFSEYDWSYWPIGAYTTRQQAEEELTKLGYKVRSNATVEEFELDAPPKPEDK